MMGQKDIGLGAEENGLEPNKRVSFDQKPRTKRALKINFPFLFGDRYLD